MNKRRSEKKVKHFSKVEIAFLLIAALVMIAGGVNYSILKNEQVNLVRQTEKVRQEVKRYDSETRSVNVEIDRKINRFAIKSELREIGSIMRERPDFVVEQIHPVARPIVGADNIKKQFPNLFFQAEVDLPN